MVQEVRVKEQPELGAGEQEVGPETPNLRRDLEEELGHEDEPVSICDAQENRKRGDERGCCKCSVEDESARLRKRAR